MAFRLFFSPPAPIFRLSTTNVASKIFYCIVLQCYSSRLHVLNRCGRKKLNGLLTGETKSARLKVATKKIPEAAINRATSLSTVELFL